jgi:hypothetical protein
MMLSILSIRVPPTRGVAFILKSKGTTETIRRLAGHVTVGNEFLAQFARRHARAVIVVPTTIYTNLYDISAREFRTSRRMVGKRDDIAIPDKSRAGAPALERQAGIRASRGQGRDSGRGGACPVQAVAAWHGGQRSPGL